MQKINLIINKKVQVLSLFPEKKGLELKRKPNRVWETADEFAKYVGLNTIYVLKLIRIYGIGPVLSTRSYLKDFPDTGEYKDKSGLIRWKLEEIRKAKNT